MKKIQVFDQLLESVKSNSPGLISEEVQNQMKKQFDEAITDIQTQAKEQGKNEGQKTGFQAGYEEGKRIAAQKAKAEFDKLIEKCDEQATQKMQEVIEALDKSNTAKLEEVYQLLKDTKQKSEEALEKCDEQATQKMQEVLDMLDDVNTAKLEEVYQLLKAAKEEAQDAKDALEAQDADYTEKMQEVADVLNDNKEAELAAMDEDYANKLETAINAKDEADAEKLEAAIKAKDEADTEKLKMYAEAVDKHHAHLLQEAVQQLDHKHALVLEQVVKEVDQSNAKKLQNIVNVIKEQANKRMKKLETIYESKLKAQKDKKVEILAESVEKYINYALEQHLPKKQLVSQAKYETAMKAMDKITDFLKVNTIVQESKDDVFKDYEKEISNARLMNNKLISQKIELTDKLQRQEAQLVLESKLKMSTPAQAKFLREYFKNAKSPRIIEESIEDAKASFRKIQSEKRAALKATLDNKVSTRPSSVVTESVKSEVKESKKITDSNNKQQPQDIAEFYANYLVKKH